jgi:hypothetical protein
LRPSRIPQQRLAPGDLQVLLALPGWTVMRSTDRDYVYERFPRLNGPFRVCFRGNYGVRSLTLANAQHVLERIGPKLGLPLNFHGALPGLTVDPKVQVIFSYGQFPFGLESAVPILWEHTFAPQRGTDAAAWHVLQRTEHLRAATRAARVVTATEVSADWFRRIFPELAHKIAAIPYYLPHLTGVSEALVAQKARDAQQLRVVFIGKQARRKGADTLAAAWPLLSADVRAQLSVTVLSGMYDGPVALPPEWTHTCSRSRPNTRRTGSCWWKVWRQAARSSPALRQCSARSWGMQPVASSTPTRPSRSRKRSASWCASARCSRPRCSRRVRVLWSTTSQVWSVSVMRSYYGRVQGKTLPASVATVKSTTAGGA